MRNRKLRSIVNGKDIPSNLTQPVINPFNGQEIATMELLPDTVEITTDPSPALDPQQLQNILQEFILLLQENRETLAETACEETGSPIKYHLDDVDAVIDFCKNIEFYKQRSQQQPYKLAAKGDVLILLSANEPIILTSLTVVSALVAGNRVFLKPSSKTASAPEMIVRFLHKAGLPADLLNLLLLSQPATQTLFASGKFQLILSFGSARVNDMLAKIVHPRTQFVPENEGNDWAYIDEAFPFTTPELVEILAHSFTKHNGQMCDAIRGILVHESQYQAIRELLQERIAELVVADPASSKSDLGALLKGTEGQQLSGVIATAQPQLVELTSDSAEFVSEPLFAPIAWIKPVTGAEAALNFYKQHNQHGLAFSIFSSVDSTSKLLTEEIQAARININVNPVNVDIFSPWGGIRQSGLNGAATWIEYFSNRKLINNGEFGR